MEYTWSESRGARNRVKEKRVGYFARDSVREITYHPLTPCLTT